MLVRSVSGRAQACAVILAAGSARRMQSRQNKVFLKFDEQSAVIRCLKMFTGTGLFSSIVVVCRPEERDLIERKVHDHLPGVSCIFCEGGSERQYSVANALACVPEDAEYIAVHDAARCFVTEDVITDCLSCAERFGAAVAAIPATDTVKRVEGSVVQETLDRSQLVLVQTPQIFRRSILIDAYDSARRDGFLGTDDASLVERTGVPVHICRGSADNIKLTVTRDVAEGERILERRSDMIPHVGTGFDVHAFMEGRRLILGGVDIPFSRGLAGHSDADVLVHAIMDALLGAAGLPDIGCLFPPGDARYKDADSLDLLFQVGSRIRERGYSITNIDSTLLMEKPHVAAYTRQMAANIADALGILPENVSVKATTTEKLGAFGRGEGAGAQAVCLLRRAAVHA